MTPEQRSQALRDGEDAALALDKLPIDAAKQAIKDEWGKAVDRGTREDLWNELKAMERVHARLWSMIQGAKSAAYEIKQDEQAKTSVKDPYVP
jgi:hypothetical protein